MTRQEEEEGHVWIMSEVRIRGGEGSGGGGGGVRGLRKFQLFAPQLECSCTCV